MLSVQLSVEILYRRVAAFHIIAAIFGAASPFIVCLDLIPGEWFDAIIPNNPISVIYQGKFCQTITVNYQSKGFFRNC